MKTDFKNERKFISIIENNVVVALDILSKTEKGLKDIHAEQRVIREVKGLRSALIFVKKNISKVKKRMAWEELFLKNPSKETMVPLIRALDQELAFEGSSITSVSDSLVQIARESSGLTWEFQHAVGDLQRIRRELEALRRFLLQRETL